MRKASTMKTRVFFALMLGIAVLLGTRLAAQVQTEVPPVVPGAKSVTVEHIKIHGTALEGNLEGDAVDRERLCLPAAELCHQEVPPLSGRLCLARIFDRRGAVDSRNPCAPNH